MQAAPGRHPPAYERVVGALAELLANKYESAARAERMGYGKYAASRLIYYTCIAFEISTPVRPTLLSRPAVPLEVTHLWKKIG